MKNRKALKTILSYISTLILVACMTVSAEILNEKEIIFPEITALAIGYLVAEKRSWKVNGRRMLGLISLCAVFGVLIVRYIHLGIYPQIIIAFAISQIVFMFSKTTFAPLISAIVLPVMMQTTSFVYPLAAFLLTVAVILFRKIFESTGIKEKEPYEPVTLNFRADIIDTVIRIICVSVIGYIAFSLDFRFAVAPPLLVVFTEFSRPNNKARLKPIKPVLVLTACAFVGVLARYIINIQCGLPLTIAALMATAIMLMILYFAKVYMPPVGAITILSMIIPQASLLTYPLQIFAGSAVTVILSRLLFMRRQKSL